MRGSLENIDPLKKVPFKRAISRVKKGPLQGVFLMLSHHNVGALIIRIGFWRFLIIHIVECTPKPYSNY